MADSNLDLAGLYELIKPSLPKWLQGPVRLGLAALATLGLVGEGLRQLWHWQLVKDLVRSPWFSLFLWSLGLFLFGMLAGYFLRKPKSIEAKTQTPVEKEDDPSWFELWLPRGEILWRVVMDGLRGRIWKIEPRCTECKHSLNVENQMTMMGMSYFKRPKCINCERTPERDIEFVREEKEARLLAESKWTLNREEFKPIPKP